MYFVGPVCCVRRPHALCQHQIVENLNAQVKPLEWKGMTRKSIKP